MDQVCGKIFTIKYKGSKCIETYIVPCDVEKCHLSDVEVSLY